MTQSRAVPFASLDTAAIARALSQIADRPADLADVFLERRQQLRLPSEDEEPGLQLWREEGLAVRLLRDGNAWLASRDQLEAGKLSEALRQVARALPVAAYPEPEVVVGPWPAGFEAPELAEFVSEVHRSLRAQHVGFPLQLAVTWHRRWSQVVGTQLVAPPQEESFYSCEARLPWGRHGVLLASLEDTAAEVARSLMGYFRARQAPPPEPLRGPVVLSPTATAVLLHEAVAHALEADTLALGGRPEAAVGVCLGCPGLHVLDDPSAAPEGVRRSADDEGVASERRWLLRDGVIEQPLADSYWSRRFPGLTPGAARRGSRHQPPVPRSTHLEVLPGDLSADDLVADADGGLYVTEVSRGQLDPLTGEIQLYFPFARRLRGGEIADPVGPCRLRGTVGNLLAGVSGIAREARTAGAGWCAKGGQKLAVWATTPALRLTDVEVVP